MSEKENAVQEIADDLLTDPDKDAEGKPPPAPPQTIEAEPSGEGKGGR
ncbi:hypothetical protein [Sphingomonas sp.]